jgi:hypothetical protein
MVLQKLSPSQMQTTTTTGSCQTLLASKRVAQSLNYRLLHYACFMCSVRHEFYQFSVCTVSCRSSTGCFFLCPLCLSCIFVIHQGKSSFSYLYIYISTLLDVCKNSEVNKKMTKYFFQMSEYCFWEYCKLLKFTLCDLFGVIYFLPVFLSRSLFHVESFIRTF